MSMTLPTSVSPLTPAFWDDEEPKKTNPKPQPKAPLKEAYESDFHFGSVKSEKSLPRQTKQPPVNSFGRPTPSEAPKKQDSKILSN